MTKKVTISYNNEIILPETVLETAAIKYGNQEIQTDFTGTKILKCNNKIFNNDIIIDTKTLPCTGTIANSDITVTSSPTKLYIYNNGDNCSATTAGIGKLGGGTAYISTHTVYNFPICMTSWTSSPWNILWNSWGLSLRR